MAMPATAQRALGHFGRYDITTNGMIQGDANWYDSDTVDLTGHPDQSGNADYAVRRAQFYLKGKSAGRLQWSLGYDAAAGKWLDADLRYGFDDSQTMRIGKFKQPNGLERLSSARTNDFMSRSMLSDTFAIGRRLGVSYRYHRGADPADDVVRSSGGTDGDWSVEASYVGPAVTTNHVGQKGGFGLRGTLAPFNADGRILHIGLSYVNYGTSEDIVHLRARPNADLTPVWLVNTGDLANTDRIATIGAESFWADGPLKLQGEYMTTRADRHDTTSGDFLGHAGYISAVWNLTGQHWGYNSGVPVTLVAPRMWQLALRYDAINLNDASVRGGWMRNWTAGVNWYWDTRWKFMLNHVWARSKRDGVSDNPNITEMRVQRVW